MGFIAAKCTQCGANIQVDDSKDAGICPNCGTAFVTEKVISLYKTINNVDKQINIYHGNNKFEEEKNQCKVLLMLLKNFDLQFLKERALKVLDINPDNSLAQMIYDCDYRVSVYGDFSFIEINEKPMLQYLEKECGNIDAETCVTFIKTLIKEVGNGNDAPALVKLIIKNLTLLNLPTETLISTYYEIADCIGDIEDINYIIKTSKMQKTLGWLSFFDSSVDEDNFQSAQQNKNAAASMFQSRKIIAQNLINETKNLNFSEKVKNKILNKLNSVYPVNSINSSTPIQTKQQSDNQTTSGNTAGGVFLIILSILFFILAFTFFPSGEYTGVFGICFLGGVILYLGIKLLKKNNKQ